MGGTVIRGASGGTAGTTGAIAIERVGDAPDVNVSTLGTIDWFANGTANNAPRASTSSRLSKVGGTIITTWTGATAGQSISATVMNATTRTSDASDSTEGSNINTSGSWGVSTINASTGFFCAFSVPSSPDERVLRVYCANSGNLARLTCTLDDGTTESIDADNDTTTATTHEYKVTFSGGTRMLVEWRVVEKNVGTNIAHALAFAAATLGLE